MPKKNSKSLYVAALALLTVGIGYLIVTGIMSSRTYEVQVAEVLSMPLDKPRSVRIAGEVRLEGLSALEEGVGVRFQIQDHQDPSKHLWAVYRGAVPDLFEPGAPVMLEGTYAGPDKDFTVVKLHTLCPSKYEQKLEEVKQS